MPWHAFALRGPFRRGRRTVTRRIRSFCCARTASGHAAAAPPRKVMNSRRLIADPEAQTEHRSGSNPHWERVRFRSLSVLPMSALGHKQTCAVQYVMSALPPIADMCGARANLPRANGGHFNISERVYNRNGDDCFTRTWPAPRTAWLRRRRTL